MAATDRGLTRPRSKPSSNSSLGRLYYSVKSFNTLIIRGRTQKLEWKENPGCRFDALIYIGNWNSTLYSNRNKDMDET